LLDSIKRWNERRKKAKFASKLSWDLFKLIERRNFDSDMSDAREMIKKRLDIGVIQSEITRKMMRIPELRLAFPYFLEKSWDDAVKEFSTLKGKSYEDIKSFKEKITMWGNIGGEFIRISVALEVLNWRIKSPELELYVVSLLFSND
jgi:hypothetical protein